MARKLQVGILSLMVGMMLIAAGCSLAQSAAAPGMVAPAEMANGLIRLHVVANSDSEADQELKRAVRDAILAEVTPLFVGLEDGNQAREAIAQSIPQIEAAAAKVISDWGQQYPVHAEVGRFHFPGKAYGRVFLPAGEYNALKVLIGEGAGANWWCILFPPMCFVDWSTGIVLEPTPESGGTQTVAVSRKQAVALVEPEKLERAPVKARSAVLDWVRNKVKAVRRPAHEQRLQ